MKNKPPQHLKPNPPFVDSKVRLIIQVPKAMQNSPYQILIQPYNSYNKKATLCTPITTTNIVKADKPMSRYR